jgi:hypothetical protein
MATLTSDCFAWRLPVAQWLADQPRRQLQVALRKHVLSAPPLKTTPESGFDLLVPRDHCLCPSDGPKTGIRRGPAVPHHCLRYPYLSYPSNCNLFRTTDTPRTHVASVGNPTRPAVIAAFVIPNVQKGSDRRTDHSVMV